ncbi:MAG: xylosidase/arabinosidase [Armatimonadetes bacterium]|nr:xylosidase/arabinosidase [Armatimonadota bacterium]
MDGKVLLGYQGWFRTPHDGSPSKAWRHWARGAPEPGNFEFDLYPDVSALGEVDTEAVPGLTIAGRPARLFSSYNPRVVAKHFEWMQKHGLDGVLAQRFLSDLPLLRLEKDQVLRNVRDAAEKSGRVFAVEYDISGADSSALTKTLQDDWLMLRDKLKLTASKSYLRHRDKPVVSIWGMGLNEPGHPPVDPKIAPEIVRWFKKEGGCTVIGGTPAYWRTRDRDARPDEAWSAYYRRLDVVQPWTVGRFDSLEGADHWAKDRYGPDLAETEAWSQMSMPVVFPGFSWHNLKPDFRLNQIPRQGGRFLWRQAVAAQKAGVRMLKIAMFDEVNESTAMLPAASTRKQAPDQGVWLTLDADGTSLPSDWYLRLAGQITRAFHSRLPLPAEPPRP